MQIPDFRHYSQTETRKISERNILTWTPRRSDFAAQKSDAEIAKTLHLLAKDMHGIADGDGGEMKSDT